MVRRFNLVPRYLLSLAIGLSCVSASYAADDANTKVAADNADVQALKQQLAEQKQQIEELRLLLLDQKKQLDGLKNQPIPAVNATASPEPVAPLKPSSPLSASTTPVVPRAVAVAKPDPLPLPIPQQGSGTTGSPANPCEANPEAQVPTYFRIGNTCLVPVGFMDLTAVWRDKNAGSSLGSNFGSVPYNNVAGGNNSEFRFTPQNSRIGFRFDGNWKGTHFIGYNEFDFLGTSGSSAVTVTNGAFVPRLRLFWVDVRKGAVEFLAGQSWSMLTPNRTGISALPGNIFFSQVIDVNYMAGLTWTRQPGVRVLFHPSNKATFGLSFENPDQYIGGSAGGSAIVLPSKGTAAPLAGLAGTQLDQANVVLGAATVHPDIIAKLALDPSPRFHFEVAGIERTFKVWNPGTTGPGALQHSTTEGGGLQFGLNAEIFKNFRLITTNYWSDGGGRYLFGQAPDVVVRPDGSLSGVHADGTVDGFEARVKPNLLLYGYYGGIYIGRNAGFDADGTTRIGYGYPGSSNSQNRSIQEVTFGFNQTIWGNARYGAVNLMGQYEYLMRNPWSLTGTPKATHDNTIFVNIRYTLPGAMPNF